MATKKLHFETLQLHVGQNSQTRLQMLVQFLFIRLHLMYFITRHMQPHVLVYKIRVIFMGV